MSMRHFILSAALAVVGLGFAENAQAQYVVNGGYSQGYYGGYSPDYYGNGGVIQTGGYYSNSYNYSSYPSYGYNNGYNNYSPSYYGNSNYSPALGAYYSFYRRGNYGNNYNYNRRYR